jgi:hypothetical protein
VTERLEQLWKPYRRELRRDFVALSELVRRIHRADPDLDGRKVREATLELLRYALVRGDAEAGQFEDGDFAAWGQPPDEVVRRAAAAWDELGGREPNVGEILWLREPRSG